MSVPSCKCKCRKWLHSSIFLDRSRTGNNAAVLPKPEREHEERRISLALFQWRCQYAYRPIPIRKC